MKILHVIPALAARYGGPSTATINMCRSLKDCGIETLIVTTDADGRGRLPVDLAHLVTYQGAQVIFFPRQWSEAFKYSLPLERWLEANIECFDLVHIEAVFSHSSLAAAGVCQRHHIPYIVRPVGSLDPWSLNQKQWRKRLFWQVGVKQMLQRAAAIHYTTAEERRLAEDKLGLKRGVVIPVGIDDEFLNAQVEPGTFRQRYPSLGKNPYVLTLCRLHPKKGLDLFLKVFLEVTSQDEFKHWQLVVAGDGEARYVNSLKRQVRKLKGNQRVLFTGWLDNHEKAAALREAALHVLSSYQENFGLSVAEAMASGVPVLVSRQVNLAEEICACQAGWVSDLNQEDLSQALKDAFHSEEERARRGAAGRQLALSRFKSSTVAREIAQLYRALTCKT